MKFFETITLNFPKSFFVKGDILDNKVLNKIKKWKPQIIYHIAAQSGGESAYDDPKYDYLSNGYGTYLLSVLAEKIKIKHFIYASSVAVYGSNKNKKIFIININKLFIY